MLLLLLVLLLLLLLMVQYLGMGGCGQEFTTAGWQRMIAGGTGTRIDLHIGHCEILLLLLLMLLLLLLRQLMQQLLGSTGRGPSSHRVGRRTGTGRRSGYTGADVQVAVLIAALSGDRWLGHGLEANGSSADRWLDQMLLLLLLMMLLLLLLQAELVIALQAVRRLVIFPGGYGGHTTTVYVNVNQVGGALGVLVRLGQHRSSGMWVLLMRMSHQLLAVGLMVLLRLSM